MNNEKIRRIPKWKRGLLIGFLGLTLTLTAAGFRVRMEKEAQKVLAGANAVEAGIETRRIALTFDDDVIIGLSQEISYKEAVSMI